MVDAVLDVSVHEGGEIVDGVVDAVVRDASLRIVVSTDFNRTVYDALANENILDMQGITEAVSKYFYSNGDSFDGLFVAPEHQERFERLASDAIEYYEN